MSVGKHRAFRDLKKILRVHVGTPLAYEALSSDLTISPNTVKKYLSILEDQGVIFRLKPFSEGIHRSLLKSFKVYFCDPEMVEKAYCENQVALFLKKNLAEGESLHFLRTKEKREIDFAIIRSGTVDRLVDTNPSIKALRYFHRKYGFRSIQVVKNLRQEFTADGIEILEAEKFLKGLRNS